MTPPLTEHALVPLVEEVVTCSSNAEFRNDVQIRQFWSSNNLDLAQDYIFTRAASAGRHSSVQLLRILCEAFMPGASPNRFVFIATYGHGKSHFGVATANFFGKSADTPEFKGVLARISHAVHEEATIGFFQAFKRNNPRHLILILPGDEPSDLQTKFFRAVNAAIENSGEEITLPFWYAEAGKFIEGVNADPELRKRADQFLTGHGIDTGVLLDRIRSQQASTYEITRALCLELHHLNPDFGSGIGLKEAIEWLANNLVGTGRPFSGILILFDEFSAFVRDYALKYQHRPGAPLQDLLNGVETTRGKVTFAALAQRDPELIAKSLIGNGDSLRTLITELNRLPKPQQYQLHSSLEEVLAAYLKQNSASWKRLFSIPQFLAAFGHASDLCYDIFQQRYQDTLQWGLERFQEVVAQGCFPLHPSTTALLSSVEFESTSNPRSVLGFVTKHLEILNGETSWEDGRPRWVLPTALVDYFGEMLGDKLWADFSDAIIQAGGPDIPKDEGSVLKAMLLQIAGKVATRGAYDRVIGEFSGISPDRAAAALQSLASKGVIQRHNGQRTYNFWPAGRGANKVEQILSQKAKTCLIDADVLGAVTHRLKQDGFLKDIQVSVAWGHREDWYAEQLILTKDTVSVETIQHLVISHLRWRPNSSALPRGLVLWLVADTPEAVAWLRDCSADILDRSFPGQGLPIVIMKPMSAHPELQEQLIRLHCLNEFSNSEIADVGQEQYEAQRELVLDTLKSALKALDDDAEMEVSVPFKGHMEKSRPASVELALGELFPMAYSKGPRKWFQQYKQGQMRLRNSSGRVVTHLLNNSIYLPNILDSDSVAKDIAFEQLKANWFILGSDLRIIQPPPRSSVRAAWDLLEKAFPAAGQPKIASGVIADLCSFPYGFDANTAALLMAAWLGFYRHDLEISIQGQLRSVSTFMGELKPKDFVEQLAGATIRKLDGSVVREKIQILLRRVERDSFNQSEATESQELLTQALERDDLDERAAIEGALEKIRKGLQSAQAYDGAVQRIEVSLQSRGNINSLIEINKQITNLQVPRFVLAERPSPPALSDIWLAKMKEHVESQCRERSLLARLQDYSLNHEFLLVTKKRLEHLQLHQLLEMVDSALKELSNAKERLEQEQREQASIAIIQSMSAAGPVQQLRENLSKLNGMEIHIEQYRNIQEGKIRAIKQEIGRLERFREELPARLDSAFNVQEVERIQNDLLRNQNLFEGSPEAEELQEYLGRCENLRSYFSSIDEYRKRDVSAPDVADRIIADLNSLSASHYSSLSEAQKQVSVTAAEGVAAEAIDRNRRAVDWLFECEQQFDGGSALNELLSRLSSPPVFLPIDQEVRLETLRTKVQQRREAQQRESEALATLKTISTRGSLAYLRQQIEAVEAIESPSDNIQKEIEGKLTQLRTEIKRLEIFQGEIPTRLDAISDLQGLDLVQGDLLRNQNLFEGTAEAEGLAAGLNRCATLRSFFTSIEERRKRELTSPGVADQVVSDLKSLLTSHAWALSEVQTRTNAAAIERVAAEVSDHARRAVGWLEEREQQFAEGSPADELLSRLVSPPAFFPNVEQHRLDALRENVQKRLVDQQREIATLTSLKTITTNGGLAHLRRQLQVVEALDSPSDKAQREIETKLSQLHGEIARLETLQRETSIRLDGIYDLQGLDRLHGDLLRNQNLFEGTPEEDELQAGLDRCEALRSYFYSVEQHKRSELKSPDIATRIIAELEQLRDAQMKCSPQQYAVAGNAIKEISDRVNSLAGIALEWLGDCQRAVESESDPVELALKLSSPPPFLPDSSRLELENVTRSVKERIDQDEVLSVVAHFRKITDRSRRLECLQELTEIAKEG